jgi:hypothetical protein
MAVTFNHLVGADALPVSRWQVRISAYRIHRGANRIP